MFKAFKVSEERHRFSASSQQYHYRRLQLWFICLFYFIHTYSPVSSEDDSNITAAASEDTENRDELNFNFRQKTKQKTEQHSLKKNKSLTFEPLIL